jgi:hypothetical protein
MRGKTNKLLAKEQNLMQEDEEEQAGRSKLYVDHS